MRNKKLITALSEISDRVVASKTTESIYFYMDSLCVRVSNHLTFSTIPDVYIYPLNRGYVAFLTKGVTEQQYCNNVQEVVNFCLQLKKWTYLLLSRFVQPKTYECVAEEDRIDKPTWDAQLQCVRIGKKYPFAELCDKLFTVAPPQFRKYLIYQLRTLGPQPQEYRYQVLVRYIHQFDPEYEILPI